MPEPVLHLIAGPNGAGKTTFFREALVSTNLEFVNADAIAAKHWPSSETAHAYDASRLAAQRRDDLMRNGRSFVTETVFSHASKVELVRRATRDGYRVNLYVILVPEDLAVVRVRLRAAKGGHDVPVAKIRERYRRLWTHVLEAITIAAHARVYDNSITRSSFTPVATFRHGTLTQKPRWPRWAPLELRRCEM